MLKEFKEFIDRGSVVDLAVAVVIGAAFGAVVASFTDDVLMQTISAFVGEPDFSSLSFTLNGSEIRYGAFLTALVNFLILAFAVFLVVKAYNTLRTTEEEEEGPSEIDLLTEIRDSLGS
ncbi:MAG: large conductance mechanosensitive channel protein MscL [Acidimicrobiia bacterium]|nr:large conductance mechanosensitive channel protein MscL [Acidimicrobiia bacterium]